MPPNKQDADEAETPLRDKAFHVRMDPKLFDDATAAAGQYGLGPVVRALLRAYLRGDIRLTADDLLKELSTAPKRPRKPRAK